MVLKWQSNLPGVQTRSSVLASALLLLFSAFARPLTAQDPGSPITFTAEVIQGLVDDHNEFRGRVEPTARNIQAMVSSINQTS